MSRLALPDSLQLCRISGCLYTPCFQDQYFSTASSSTDPGHRNFSHDVIDNPFMRHTFQNHAGYPRILDFVDLRPLRGRYAYKASLRSALPRLPRSCARRSGCLYTSFDQYHDSVFFSFSSIKPAMLPASMLGDYSTSASSTPSCFPRRTDLLGNPFPITSLLDLLFFFFLFWIIIPAILPATMLGYYSMSASSMPSKFIQCRFDVLEAYFL
jgi:hypothetical protein